MARIATKFIAANAVTNAKLATMVTNTLKGNNSSSTSNPLDLTTTQVTAMLNPFVGDSGSGGIQGLVPAPPAGSNAAFEFLCASGSWNTVELDAYSNANYGSITTTSTSFTLMSPFTDSPVAGTYWMTFSCGITCNSSGASVSVCIYYGGIQVPSTIRTVTPQFNNGLGTTSLQLCVSTNCLLGISAGQSLAIYWMTTAGTATAINGNFDLVKIR